MATSIATMSIATTTAADVTSVSTYGDNSNTSIMLLLICLERHRAIFSYFIRSFDELFCQFNPINIEHLD